MLGWYNGRLEAAWKVREYAIIVLLLEKLCGSDGIVNFVGADCRPITSAGGCP